MIKRKDRGRADAVATPHCKRSKGKGRGMGREKEELKRRRKRREEKKTVIVTLAPLYICNFVVMN